MYPAAPQLSLDSTFFSLSSTYTSWTLSVFKSIVIGAPTPAQISIIEFPLRSQNAKKTPLSRCLHCRSAPTSWNRYCIPTVGSSSGQGTKKMLVLKTAFPALHPQGTMCPLASYILSIHCTSSSGRIPLDKCDFLTWTSMTKFWIGMTILSQVFGELSNTINVKGQNSGM